MLILSLSMTVHIVVRYKQILIENELLPKDQKILLTIKKMFLPCCYAALTTIFAFATLYTSGIKPVMDFGLMMCTGIFITFITSFIFLPIIIYNFNFVERTTYFTKGGEGILTTFINKFKNIILLSFLIIFIIGVYGATKLKVENSFVDYFKKIQKFIRE